MSTLNAILRSVFDAALFPFRELHPLIGLAVVSLVFGIAVLLVYKVTSNQEKLTAVKRRIHAGIFEIRLFNDSLRAIMRAMGGILRHNLTYLRLSAVPLLWMIAPLVLVIAQLQFHYGYQGLTPGDDALLKVQIAGDWTSDGAHPRLDLEVPSGVAIDSGPVWIPSLGEMTWRISAEEWGNHQLTLVTDDGPLTKSLSVSNAVVRRSTHRLAPGFFNQLLYPAEDPIPGSSPVQSILLTYPAGNAGIEGWESEWTWMLVFFILSVVFAFALRKPLNVTI
ncbi:MAG: hypothetical protein AAF560_07295 [Acidobacteriota bacterium]